MAYSDSTIKFGALSAVTATRGPNDPSLGDVAEDANGKYRYVYCSDAAVTGQAVCMTATAGGWTVSVGTVTGVDYPVGWTINTLSTGTYGWVQTQGIVKVQMSAAVSAAIGALLTVGSNGFMISSQYSGATATLQGPAVARALSNIASTSSGYAYVR
jgi:hypothetical protein